ncbi:MAG: hypothetical protein AAF726_17985 [Planctomycetota bacterium]
MQPVRRPRAESTALLRRKESVWLTHAELAEESGVSHGSLIRWLPRVRLERQREVYVHRSCQHVHEDRPEKAG